MAQQSRREGEGDSDGAGVDDNDLIQQEMAIDTRVFGGRFRVSVALLVSMEAVFMLLWVLLHNVLVMPVARRWWPWLGVGLTQLQRMGMVRVVVVSTAMASHHAEAIHAGCHAKVYPCRYLILVPKAAPLLLDAPYCLPGHRRARRP